MKHFTTGPLCSPERLCGWWQSARGCDDVYVAGAVRVLPGLLRDENAFQDPQGKPPLLPDGHKSKKNILGIMKFNVHSHLV